MKRLGWWLVVLLALAGGIVGMEPLGWVMLGMFGMNVVGRYATMIVIGLWFGLMFLLVRKAAGVT